MEELYHRCHTNAPLEFIFTTNTGQVVEVKAEDLPVTSPYSPNFDPNAMDHPRSLDGELPAEVVLYLKDKKLRAEDLNPSTTDGAADIKAQSFIESDDADGESPRRCSASFASLSLGISRSSSSTSIPGTSSSGATLKAVSLSMVYNEYGELVSAHEVLHPPHSKDMSSLQIMRIIKKAYHHNYCKKMAAVIAEFMDSKSSVVVDDGHLIPSDRLSAWEFRLDSSSQLVEYPKTPPDEKPSVAIHDGPPRILEIGCGDGIWCFQAKKKHPDRIIEGTDDKDHWSCAHTELNLRDFMNSNNSTLSNLKTGYCNVVRVSQEHTEFTVCNINQLLKHAKPIPHNLYGLIRARDIFDKIESYKTFLEDVRLSLQPDGVVEFLEIDPRPRHIKARWSHADIKDDHKSGPKMNWTENIADRFKNEDDEQIARDVPGWMTRVEEFLKASLRPHDGVPGPQLKSWLEGAGFHDVKQAIFRLPVGGDSKAGKLLQDFIFFKHTNKDEIPILKNKLPAIERAAIESGNYYLNLHIVTGRKPHDPRAGDLLLNGSRQEMTASKYEAMARINDSKTNQWKRLDLDNEITGLVHGLSVLSGAPPLSSSPPALNRGGGRGIGNISPLLTVDGPAQGKKAKDDKNLKLDVVKIVKDILDEI